MQTEAFSENQTVSISLEEWHGTSPKVTDRGAGWSFETSRRALEGLPSARKVREEPGAEGGPHYRLSSCCLGTTDKPGGQLEHRLRREEAGSAEVGVGGLLFFSSESAGG